MSSQTSAFRSLHAGSELLILPNAWDAGSARIVEIIGAKAVATTSAGMAWALGIPDGYKLEPNAVLRVSEQITKTVKIPVSIDVEDGYSSQPLAVAEFALRLVDAGGSGVNIEDGADPTELLAKKIEAIKTAVSKRGVDLFINARTDVVLARLVPDSAFTAETIRRGNAYRSAGADGLFVPGLAAPSHIAEIAKGVELPLNVMAFKDLPLPPELVKLGAKRLSAGAGLAQLAIAETLAKGKQFLESGSTEVFDTAVPYSILQNMFKRE